MTASTAVILAAHGATNDPRVNRRLFEIAAELQQTLPGVIVTPAFLKGDPNVRTISDSLQAKRLIVVPFMTSQGYYTDVVFPGALKRANNKVEITQAIGMHPLVGPMIASRLEQLLGAIDKSVATTILIVGHGTRRNRKSCRSTVELVHYLRKSMPELKFRFAFIDQRPGLEFVVQRLDSETLVVIPFLMCLGPHATIDVPRSLGLPNLTEQLLASQFQFPLIESCPINGRSPTVYYDLPVGIYQDIKQLVACTIKPYLGSLGLVDSLDCLLPSAGITNSNQELIR